MSFQGQTCGKCFSSYEYYQRHKIVPPCPRCGYPELKTREDYYRSVVGETLSPAPNDLSHNRRSANDEDLKWL